jgi:hypothetical protein
MEGRLHRRVLVPVLLVAGTVVGIGAFAVLGVRPAFDPLGARPSPTAGESSSPSPEACKPRFRRFADDASRATWFTLDQQTDTNGVLTGNVVRVARAGGGPVVALELPPEAWAEGPYDEGALVGSDDGQTSTLRFLAPRGCGRTLVSTSDYIIWRATISPDGQNLLTYHLERGTRRELGLWIAPLADPTQNRQLVRPVPPDERFGITWGTALKWSADGDRLVVESCTPKGCRFQLVDPSTGAEAFIDDDGLGEFVGLDGDRLFAFADCIDFRPCQLLERNLVAGVTRELHPGANDAWLVTVRGQPRLLATESDGVREDIKVIDPDTGDLRPLPLPTLLAGLGPVRNNDYGSVGLPRGWIALAPGGEVPRPNGNRRMFAFDIESSRLLMLVGGNS